MRRWLCLLILLAACAVPSVAAASSSGGASAPADPAPASAPAQPAPAKGSVALSLTRPEIRRLQRALHVTADGRLGPRTRAALRRAERRGGLPVDGRPDADVLRGLGLTPPTAAATPPASTTPVPGGLGTRVVAAARSRLGAPYGRDAAGPDAFDCSGFTAWVFARAGVTLPRSSFAQYATGRSVAAADVAAGDLVFFDSDGPGASHVGVAVAPGRVISATTHGVREHPLDGPYWREHYVGARRLG